MKIPRAAEIAALVQPDRVHRDVYLSDEVFALEREHFFANTWNYLGHASQVPAPGDYLARNFDAAELDDPTCDVRRATSTAPVSC